ncbi:MAG: hypothetical protein EAZ99_05215 [Alphaproteobacteria bacterium]|nr:MAG: hypothetical protein EAZ99_05215 [Alphaproteobacteria bacterium]
MYRDKSLLPTQAVRLCVLGTLARGSLRYSELAAASRRFMAALTGPNLDLLGTSIELLRIEGLIRPLRGEGQVDDAEMALTDTGREVLLVLLTAPLRAPSTDMTRLILALKLRFLDLLPMEERSAQIDLLIDAAETELARLDDLATAQANESGALHGWLTLERANLTARLEWLNGLWRPGDGLPSA